MKKLVLLLMAAISLGEVQAQTCPTSGSNSVGLNPNTYYPGTQATVNVGATSITIGAAGSGTTAISAGDIVLIIQMQGAEINSSVGDDYGNGVVGGNGNGYLNNANHLAGNMEFAVATNSVTLAGGTLNLSAGTTLSYANSNFGSFGQYRFQVIRVPVYFDAALTANITAPAWNGTTGGVIAIQTKNNFGFAGFTIDASGRGFRGGGGRQLAGPGSGANTDFRTAATSPVHGAKGEGTAGTPRYINNAGSLVDNGVEGYPSGSQGRGAPGNAGGGGNDASLADNQENSGGAGGGNGGTGGRGGNSWNSGLSLGGEPGASFGQNSAARAVMGGGGGSASTNNGTGTPGSGFASSGAAGGGIVILLAKNIVSAGTINVNGANANGSVLNDGSGGGGAGGSIILFANTGSASVTATANGGNGGTNTGGGAPHGPGGGGGGGVIFSNANVNASSSVAPGTAGNTSSGVFGAANGVIGTLVQNTIRSAYIVNANACLVLPARLISFTATPKNGTVVLKWISANEENVKEYVLEKSTDGTSFQAIGTIKAKGVAGANTNYELPDIQITKTNNYYRLRIIDSDNEFAFSNVVLFRENMINEKAVSVYPNPVVDGNAKLIIPQELLHKKLSIRIVAQDGRTLAVQQQVAYSNTLNLFVSKTVKGIVLIQVVAEGEKNIYSCKSLLK